MKHPVGFDIISDLKLRPEDSFNWENKATSLYCLIPGNVSSDLRTIVQTLSHLSRFYQGIFYVPGWLEYDGINEELEYRTLEIEDAISEIPSVVMLYQNIVFLNSIAITGINGWSNIYDVDHQLTDLKKEELRNEDVGYLSRVIDRLQRHLDIKQVVVISSAVPKFELYFGEENSSERDQTPIDTVLCNDTEHKVSHWVFGSYEKVVDANIENINYVNNPYVRKSPYWAKRITLTT